MTTTDLNQVLTAPIKRSLSDEVTARIREAILSGKITPGARLLEESLAASLQVSCGPVREALTQLEREGLVLISPNRGASVARLSREDLDEIYSLRMSLESLAVREAVKHPDNECFKDMQLTVDKMEVALNREQIDEREVADLDVRFHKELVQSGQHKRLYRCWQELRPQIHMLLLARNVIDPDFRAYHVPGHQVLLDAVRAGDEALALSRLDEHMRGSYDRVIRGYKVKQ